MPKLRELHYREVVKRLRRLGFRFYRQGRGSHELWVRDVDGLVVPLPRPRIKVLFPPLFCATMSPRTTSDLIGYSEEAHRSGTRGGEPC